MIQTKNINQHRLCNKIEELVRKVTNIMISHFKIKLICGKRKQALLIIQEKSILLINVLFLRIIMH